MTCRLRHRQATDPHRSHGMNVRTMCLGLLLGWVVSLAGCSAPEEVPEIPYRATASVHDYMVWALEPAADVIWDSAGFIITEAGEQDLQPTTSEGWDKVRTAATQVAEAGNVLMIPSYRADSADWIDYAAGLIVAGEKARAAAIAHDADALFEAGGQVYNVCRACHNRYMTEE